MQFDKEIYNDLFDEFKENGKIIDSNNIFKIRLFLEKSENSLMIAKHIKVLKPDVFQPKKLFWNYWAITISYYSMLYSAKAAVLSKGYEVNDHMAAQIALGHLYVPDEIEKEEFELLNQAYKIFEDEYVKYFEDARTESHLARYSAMKKYTERRIEEIFDNAAIFIGKIKLILN